MPVPDAIDVNVKDRAVRRRVDRAFFPMGFPNMNPGSPNVPMSVYRDDADRMNRAEGLRQQRSQLQNVNKPQPLSEFQMLATGSMGRIVPIYGADLFANVPDTFAPVQRLP